MSLNIEHIISCFLYIYGGQMYALCSSIQAINTNLFLALSCKCNVKVIKGQALSVCQLVAIEEKISNCFFFIYLYIVWQSFGILGPFLLISIGG